MVKKFDELKIGVIMSLSFTPLYHSTISERPRAPSYPELGPDLRDPLVQEHQAGGRVPAPAGRRLTSVRSSRAAAPQPHGGGH